MVVFKPSYSSRECQKIVRCSPSFPQSDDFLNTLTCVPPLVFLGFTLAALKPVEIVYPPCDTRELTEPPLEGREWANVDLAQFQPEKDQTSTQLLALSSSDPKHRNTLAKMTLMRGTRNAEDAEWVKQLRTLAEDLILKWHMLSLVDCEIILPGLR